MRLLISAWAGVGNLGDDWLVHAAVRLFHGHDVTLLLEQSASTERLPSDIPTLRWPSLTRDPRTLSEFRHATACHDLLVLAGGGGFAGDQGLRSPARWAARFRMTRLPVVALGVGVGPFLGPAASLAGRFAAQRVRTPWLVRSAADARSLDRLGVTAHEVHGDLTLVDNLPRVGTCARGTGLVVSVARPGRHWDGGSLERFRTGVVATARRLAAGEPVTFLSFQTGGPNVGDETYWADAFDEVVVPTSVEEAASVMARSRGALTGRFHAALMAARLGVPQRVIGYHHKFEALGERGLDITPPSAVDSDHGQLHAVDATQLEAIGAALRFRALQVVKA